MRLKCYLQLYFMQFPRKRRRTKIYRFVKGIYLLEENHKFLIKKYIKMNLLLKLMKLLAVLIKFLEIGEESGFGLSGIYQINILRIICFTMYYSFFVAFFESKTIYFISYLCVYVYLYFHFFCGWRNFFCKLFILIL